jgi:ubiquinone/menaquinone biosynthesis C-methylase UbiE
MKKPVIWNPELFRKHFETITQNNALLSSLEKRKIDFYFKELNLNSTDVVLDAGCGYGRLSKLMQDKVSKVIGIDINSENISYARQHVGAKFEGHVVDMSLGLLPFNDKSVDKVVVDNVLMFLNEQNQVAFFKEVKRILKDGGVIAFNFENSDYFLIPLSLFFTFLYKVKANLQGKATPYHRQCSLTFYEKTLQELGFNNIRSIGDTFYRKMGIGPIEVFPKIFQSRIAKLDQSYFNSQRKRKMSTLTVAASV